MALLHDDLLSNDIVDDPEDLDLLVEGRVEEDDDTGVIEQTAGDNSDKDEEKKDDTTVKKKRKQSQRPRLNILRLMDTNIGLTAAERMFKDVKFKGKGHELEDLNLIMKKMEIWAHKLYPSFDFDDCLAKLEKMGNSKSVSTYVKKLRMGLEDDIVAPQHEGDDDDDNTDAVNTEEIGQFQKADSPDRFDQLIRNTPQEVPVQVELTDEQRERMRKNRLIAEQRRMARLQAQQAMKEKNLSIETENSVSNDINVAITGSGPEEHTSVNSQMNENNPSELQNTFDSESLNVDSSNKTQFEKDVSTSNNAEVGVDAQDKDANSDCQQATHTFQSSNNVVQTVPTDSPVGGEYSYDIFTSNDVEMEELP